MIQDRPSDGSSSGVPHSNDAHFAVWPKGCPRSLSPLKSSVYENLEVTAHRFPDMAAIIYYDSVITYADLLNQVKRFAGYLHREAGVGANDRVLLYLQNSPQAVIAYYGILAANAVIVPMNPMNRSGELEHILTDTEARAIVTGQELVDQVAPVVADRAKLEDAPDVKIIVASYSTYLTVETDLDVPDMVQAAETVVPAGPFVAWRHALDMNCAPPVHARRPEDWCVIVYSSGTTGQPKGCLHTHATTSAVILAYSNWSVIPPNATILSTLPLFHVTGMQNSMNLPIYAGMTMVMMTRWNRTNAARLIERYRVAQWRSITTMMIDFLADPDIDQHDISSLVTVGGGGAQMPASIAHKLKSMTGLDFIEGYGLSETMAPSHMNPPHAAKPQCLGIPMFDVDSRVIDPETLEQLPVGEIGEIIIHGPQVFQEYWRQPQATADAFIEHDGKRFFRSGDLGYVAEDGYFFYADRLKRMINSSGFKIWPAEVEALMHDHPAIQEVCIIAVPDPRRGETVKAVIVAKEGVDLPTFSDLETWCRDRMAAYKVPRQYEFMSALPRSGAGKVLWRELQADEVLRLAENADASA